MLSWLCSTLEHVCIASSSVVPRSSGVWHLWSVCLVRQMSVTVRSCPLVADPEAALAVFGEAVGSWGDHVEAEKAGGFPLITPEFNWEFGCWDADPLDAGEELSDNAF